MIRLAIGLATAAICTAPLTAQAQHNRNIIRDSGNGVNNTIVARNSFPGYPGGYVGYPGGPVAGLPVSYGGVQRNVITNSGNGIGNTIIARNGGGFGGYGYNPAAQFPYGMGGFGVNVNVITNSGNGIGNTISTGNNSFSPGGVNINVITNSGNGSGNTILARNR